MVATVRQIARVLARQCGTSIWMIEKNYAKFIPSETLRWLNQTAPKRPALQLVESPVKEAA